MNAPARCRECFFEGCKGDCACRCHRSIPSDQANKEAAK